MLFNSTEFIFVFLPVCLLGCYLIAATGRNRLALGWLLACSLFFYGWFKFDYLALLAASISGNYFVGERIIRLNKDLRTRKASIWLAAGVTLNLVLLGYYKYANFIVDTISWGSSTEWTIKTILLPIGISFFTFQQIAYLMDCRAGIAHRTRLMEYALFVTYFPQLIAGPIVHPNSLLPQFEQADSMRFRYKRFLEGVTIFILGLSKKVVLADAFGVWASEGFDAAAGGATLTFFEAWPAVVCYALQIYFDFSGYSDMAIGLAWMLGFRLPINFDSPYKATSIIDFWRRWHITLSSFLRDYLYFRLGGNRKGKARRWINLMLTMLLGGLWHGAGWPFVIWGGLHGIYLVFNHFWSDLRTRFLLTNRTFGIPGRLLGWSATMLAVSTAWVFFRSPNLGCALNILKSMAGMNGIVLPEELARPLSFLGSWLQSAQKLPHLAGGLRIGMVEVAGFIAVGLAIAVIGKPLHRMNVRSRYLLLIPAFALTLQKLLVSREPSEFLYFQF